MATAEKSWQFGDGLGAGNARLSDSGIIGGRDKQGIYETSTTQVYPLGYRIEFPDGRAFRYGHCVGACSSGKLAGVDAGVGVTGEAAATAHVNAAGTNGSDYAPSKTYYFKDTSVFTHSHTNDVLADGYFHILDNGHDTTVEGATYKIESTTYVASTSILQVDLFDTLLGSLGSEAEVAITGCRYRNLATASTTNTVLAGIPVRDIAAGSYGFFQTWGETTALASGSPAAGTQLVLDDGTAGAVIEWGQEAAWSEGTAASTFQLLATEPIVGYAMQLQAATGTYVPIFLQLCP